MSTTDSKPAETSTDASPAVSETAANGPATNNDASSSSLAGAQTDGAPVELHGSGLQEPEYNVEVKLSDLQADPDNPLFSVKSFEELGLYASWCHGR